MADRMRPPVNVIVSSVHGPRQPLEWAGAKLREIYSVGPILEGIGLNVTLWSYLERVYVGALCCPDRMVGLEEITEGLHPALAELRAAVPDDSVRTG
jgi:diacylglycerol O-acyltransferase